MRDFVKIFDIKQTILTYVQIISRLAYFFPSLKTFDICLFVVDIFISALEQIHMYIWKNLHSSFVEKYVM